MRHITEVEEWSDPPSRGTTYDWAAISEQLRAEPGRWGLVFENDRHAIPVALRRGSIAAMPPDEFEFQTRNSHWIDNPNGTRTRMCSLWARYNPKGE